MSMSLLDRADTRADSPTATTSTTIAAQRLRTTMAALRVSFTWFGVSKTLTPEQRATAAEAFDAEGQFLRAAKRLLDTKHPAFRAVTAVRGKIASYRKSQSLPFPEPGIRKSRCDAPGTDLASQVLPPSVVRREVPSVPLAQATPWLTALRPRSRALVPLSCGTHWATDGWAIKETTNDANQHRH